MIIVEVDEDEQMMQVVEVRVAPDLVHQLQLVTTVSPSCTHTLSPFMPLKQLETVHGKSHRGSEEVGAAEWVRKDDRGLAVGH